MVYRCISTFTRIISLRGDIFSGRVRIHRDREKMLGLAYRAKKYGFV